MEVEQSVATRETAPRASTESSLRGGEAVANLADAFEAHSFISPNVLGDFLEVQSFFHHYNDLLDSPLFQLEELFVAVERAESDWQDMVQDLHSVLTEKLFGDFEARDEAKQSANLWLVLLARGGLRGRQRELVIRTAWPQLLGGVLAAANQTDTLADRLTSLDAREYPKLPLKDKLEVLLRAVNACTQLAEVRAMHQKVRERVLRMTKQRGELAERAKEARRQVREAQEELRKAQRVESPAAEQCSPDSRRAAERQTGQRQLQRLQQSVERRKRRAEETDRAVATLKRDLLLCVHTADFMGRDGAGNALFAFAFDPTRLFLNSADGRDWLVARLPLSDFPAMLEARGALSALRPRVSLYAESAGNASAAVQRSQARCLADVLAYRSLYDSRYRGDADMRKDEISQLIGGRPLPALLDAPAISALLRFAERTMNEFLAAEQMDWTEGETTRADFDARLSAASAPAELSRLAAELEQRCLVADQLITDDEASEDSEIDFRRSQNRRGKRYRRKSVALNFWGHSMLSVKPLFRRFAAENATAAGALLLALLLATLAQRFAATRAERRERRAQLQRERAAAPTPAPRRRLAPPCATCAGRLGEGAAKCFGCERASCRACVGAVDGDPLGRWRCRVCLDAFADVRSTRARRRLLTTD